MAERELAHAYPQHDECPHPIGEEPFWQESVVLLWSDLAKGWYGFHRLGQEPHAAGGQGITTNWLGIAHRDGLRYQHRLNRPLGAGDRTADTFAGTHAISAQFGGGTARWRIDEPDCRLDLVAEDFTPRFDLFPQGGMVVEDFAPGHIEAGSTVRGTIRLDGREVSIEGLGYRDHSWGERDWSNGPISGLIRATMQQGLSRRAWTRDDIEG